MSIVNVCRATPQGLSPAARAGTGEYSRCRSYTDSSDHTCNNWTSDVRGTAQAEHFGRTGGGNTSWNFGSYCSPMRARDGLISRDLAILRLRAWAGI
jgi:hypothetical protein